MIVPPTAIIGSFYLFYQQSYPITKENNYYKLSPDTCNDDDQDQYIDELSPHPMP
jgi:hypothetical protein